MKTAHLAALKEELQNNPEQFLPGKMEFLKSSIEIVQRELEELKRDYHRDPPAGL